MVDILHLECLLNEALCRLAELAWFGAVQNTEEWAHKVCNQCLAFVHREASSTLG